jgi:uncharacterized protein VirK/YbjX
VPWQRKVAPLTNAMVRGRAYAFAPILRLLTILSLMPSPCTPPAAKPRFGYGLLSSLVTRDQRINCKSAFKAAVFVILHPLVSRSWFGFMREPRMVELWQRQPRLVDKVLRPYLNARWDAGQRATALTEHYRWLFSRFDSAAIHSLYQAPPVELARWGTPGTVSGLRLCLSYDGAFEREGDLTLGLYGLPDDPAANQAEMIVALTLSVVFIGDKRTLCIGCVQAHANVHTREHIKQITKLMYGLRPKSMLVDMARLLARRWETGLYGIDPDAHPFTSLRYRLSRRKSLAVASMRTGYLSLWHDQDAHAVCGGWHALSSAEHQRSRAEIPSHKRSMYAKRAVMLADLEQQVHASLSALESRPD